ncbi:MAG: hypothetical protein R3C56_37845 [Pirellulaceae bacterium]
MLRNASKGNWPLERKKLVAEARDLAKQELCVELDDQASQLSELRADLKSAP